ncbi:MAG: RtcB family protein, partial [Deinococcales bacterium]
MREAWARLGAELVQEGVYRAERGGVEVLVLLTEPLVETLEEGALAQLERALALPGLERVVVTPDVHTGYAVPIGFTAVSRTHLYPDTVGPDPACSVSLSRFCAPTLDALDKPARRAILDDLETHIGVSQRRRHRRHPRIGARLSFEELLAVVWGERRAPGTWVAGSPRLPERFDAADLERLTSFLREAATEATLAQIGTIGGGNHFLEVERGQGGDHYIMAHFGSRGLGGRGSELLFARLRADQRGRCGAVAGDALLWVDADSSLGRLYDMVQQAMLEYTSYHHGEVQRVAGDVIGRHLMPCEAPAFAGHIPHNFIEWRGGRYWQRKGATPAYGAT